MKISVAMCTYNGERYLPEQLRSFGAQTRLPDQLVVCDDRSSDATINTVREFAVTAPFSVQIHVNPVNLGSTKNFERAIELSTGDIIALSDQDDVWLPAKLEKFENEFRRDSSVGLVFCDGALVGENLQDLNVSSWERRNFNRREQQNLREQSAFNSLLKRAEVSGCMMAFRAAFKKLVLPIPADNPGVIHDYWVSLLIAAVARLQPVAEPLIQYRQHAKQQLGIKESAAATLSDNARMQYNHREECLRLTNLRERLFEHRGEYNVEPALRLLDSRLRHFSRREQMRAGGGRKLLLVMQELLSFRYNSHSNGLRSATKDLFLG